MPREYVSRTMPARFATHEMNRHFPADYLLSVKQGGIPDPVVRSLRGSDQIAVAAGSGKATCPWTATGRSCWRPSRRRISRCTSRTDGGPVSFPFLQIAGYVALAAVAALLASLISGRRAAKLTVIEGLATD